MSGSGVVERYLACLGAQDWDGLAATIAEEGLVRDGPFCDVVEGKETYITFLRGVFSHLQGYQLHVQRISAVSERRSYAELTETFEIDGVPTEYPECLVFEQDDDGLIRYVSVFIKRPGGEARVEGGRAG
ncbi:MAG TPA: nuclear transport factor 2 family protein [Mycobacterium sp.]|uniref:nuclear transport factor 2 family protein n=1 Tax=Mycobacterium sp. TaxID=1785 RepID=UPI002D39D222|nr:nuclear transport factor 2 family protein [Mycobacterium sp.]HZU48743.1 nuclear transport factor 2 family protein [Mycobacterium sp.]